MAVVNNLLNRFWQRFAAPQVSDQQLQETLRDIRSRLPVPVFWLLGKAQSGKTSIIHALTGNTRGEIGNGIRPCTKTAQEYAFPNDEECLLRFLDTRGLGEVNYDPTEDLRLFQNQAHLLIVVMKAMDHAQESVLKALRDILRTHPQWPVLVVQTCLHEGYDSPDRQHDQPYPYNEKPLPPHIPTNLTRSLLKQRETLKEQGIDARYVAVDLTLPEDGYAPADYGLPALWTAIEELVPLGLRGMMTELDDARGHLRDLHFRTAMPHILSYSAAAGAAAGIPVPMVDLPLVIGIQAKMCHTIASIYHQELNSQRLGEILSALGIGYLGRLGGRGLLKFIPVLGSTLNAVYSGATTYALGITLCYYFARVQQGSVPDRAEFQRIYADRLAEGQSKLKDYFEKMRQAKSAPDGH
ncbi:MAG: DUF697 domain-containing protein [Planctomycetota bacterium]